MISPLIIQKKVFWLGKGNCRGSVDQGFPLLPYRE